MGCCVNRFVWIMFLVLFLTGNGIELFAVEKGTGFEFVKARPVKLRYKHKEQGGVEFVVVNKSTLAQKVTARAVLVVDNYVDGETRVTSGDTTITIAAGKTISDTLPFAIPVEDGGYSAFVEVLQNDSVVACAGDVFCVSDNPFLFSVQFHGDQFPNMLSVAGNLKDYRKLILVNTNAYIAECKKSLEKIRARYGTYMEYFAWAHEDATILIEDSDEPYLAGQCSWPVSRKQIRIINGLLQSQGMAPVAYVNALPFGWSGFEIVRKYPEWFINANLQTELLEKYLKMDRSAGANYPAIPCHYNVSSAESGKTFLDYHIEQLLASADMYNWEAYRYDAGPLRQQDFPTVKNALLNHNPPVGIGNNMGVFGLGDTQNDKWKTFCENQSYMMEEAINSAFNSANSPQRKWEDYIDLLRLGSHLARSNNGHYTYINGSGNWVSTALGFIAGGHAWGVRDCPFADYTRFMVRYGHTFWDLRTQMLSDPQKQISVTSSRPLWWNKFVSQRIIAPGHRQVIVPLFNPPDSNEVVNTTISTTVSDAKVQFKSLSNEKVTAWLLMPEPVAKREKATVTLLANGTMSVAVPMFKGWSNIVFDCKEGK